MSGRSELPPNPNPPTDAKKQWKYAITAAISTRRFEPAAMTSAGNIARKQSDDHATEVDISHPLPKFKQNQPEHVNVDITELPHAHRKLQEEIYQEEHQVLKLIHNAIVQRLNSYGIVLTVLASVSFVAILQPPGAFDDNGKIRSPILVGCFVFFSTLSFLFTCTGLFAVVVGSSSLFRPAFFLKFETNLSLSKVSSSSNNPESGSQQRGSEGGEPSPCLFAGNEHMDDLPVLARLLHDNLERVWRLRMYLIVSLVLCVCSFGCGAFAIIGAELRNRYMLIGALSVGVVALVFEVVTTGRGLTTYHSSKWLQILRNVSPDDLPAGYIISKSPGQILKETLEGIGKGHGGSAPPTPRCAPTPRPSNKFP